MQPPVRTRVRYFLPEFATGCTPELEQGLFDKLEIQFPRYTVDFSTDRIKNLFLQELARGDLFSRQGLRNNLKFKVKEGWLFGGEISYRLRDSVFSLRLTFNPTRFAAHRGVNRVVLARANCRQILRINEENLESLRRHSVDGADNILTTYYWGTAQPFADFTHLYIYKVQELITQEFRRVENYVRNRIGTADVFPVEPNWNDWCLYNTEVYWDFNADDAVGLVHSLWPHLSSIATDLEMREHRVPDAIPNRNSSRARQRYRKNAITFEFDLGREGLSVVIYAKEYDRIRFEIRYRKSARSYLSTGATTRDIPPVSSHIVFILDRLREDAHARLSRMISNLPSSALERQFTRMNFLSMLASINTACAGDPRLFSHVLHVLMSRYGVSDLEQEGMSEAIDRLVDMNVLERRRPVNNPRHDQRYALTNRYFPLVEIVNAALQRAEE